MNLYLVRHGKALSKDEDNERALSETGVIEVHRIAEFVSSHWDVNISGIYHSPKARARQTAQMFAEALGNDIPCEEATGLKPMDDVPFWADRVNTQESDWMLVGHMPFMAKLASLLLVGSEHRSTVNFQTSAILHLEYAQDAWAVKALADPFSV